ncbi:MAG: oligosaccharide flippase family protein [Erysipelotrichaceae bacterium]|jgi:O-antigen/teichoic acid export membrane protein|nr:oligosaccharide flippase family protein [Erysipelotrichaceae bacterium]
MENNIRSNVVINIVRTLALTILSFLTFPYICRVLGDAQLGLYTWANTIAYYFLILAKVGLPNLAIRECVLVRNDKEKLSNKVQAFFLLQGVTTIASFILLVTMIFTIPAFQSAAIIIMLLSINFVSGAFSFEWLFIALEKQLYMSIRSIIILGISSILIIAMVKNQDQVYIYALITAGVTLLTSITNTFYMTKFVSFKKTMPYNFKQYLKPLSVLFILSIALALYNQTDSLVLGFIDESKVEVGSYAVGIKGIEIIIGVIAALSTVFIPRSTYYYSLEDKRYFNNLNRYSTNICFFIVIPAIITMASMSSEITSLIAGINGYESASSVLIIVSAMMLTYSLSDIIYGQILIPMRKEKFYLIAMGGGTILNIALSIGLGIWFKNSGWSIASGVAIGTICVDVLVLAFLLFVTWEWSKKIILNMNNLKLLISGILMLTTTLLLTKFYPISNLWLDKYAPGSEMSNSLTLISVVAIDAIIYIGSLLLMKEKLVTSFLKRTKSSD